jgi:hypothetical protein
LAGDESSVCLQARGEGRIFEAIVWYENQVPNLGKDFSREVIQALERAQAQPEMFRKVRGRAQRIRLKRFKPYSIYFAIKDGLFPSFPFFTARGIRRNCKDGCDETPRSRRQLDPEWIELKPEEIAGTMRGENL